MNKIPSEIIRDELTKELRFLLADKTHSEVIDMLCHDSTIDDMAMMIDELKKQNHGSAGCFDVTGQYLLEQSSANRKDCLFLQAAKIKTQIGDMLAVADKDTLHFLGFCDRITLDELKRLQKQTGSSIIRGRTPIIDAIEKELDAYFTGISALFQTPLALHASSFTRMAWEALRQIPPGQTFSYAKQAMHIGRAGATQAIGNSNKKNRIVIVIPCHRVIGADGTLTGYSGGLWRKKWLLNHEKRYFRA